MYEISFTLKGEDTTSIRKVFSARGVDFSGEVELRKIRLAYPIKKNEYGFFGSFEFEAAAEDLDKIFSDLKLEADVLRYMVTRVEENKTEKRESKKMPESVGEPAKKAEDSKRYSEPALTNEELEKKIEEILK